MILPLRSGILLVLPVYNSNHLGAKAESDHQLEGSD